MKTTRRLSAEVITLALLIGVILGSRIPDVLAGRLSAAEFFDRLVDIRAELVRNYVKEPDQDLMMEGAIRGMLETLDDPYTVYFDPEQFESFETSVRGKFSGIGAEIGKEGDYVMIVSPLEDCPAFKAGVMAGDLIIAVDGESIVGFSTEEAVERITGPRGTDVVLTLRRGQDEFDLTITRDTIEIQTIKGVSRDAQGRWDYMLDPQHKVGYIRMTQFSEPTTENLRVALEQLQSQEAEGLILDLRFNPGGRLDAAIMIADLFLGDGIIVSTKGRTSPERVVKANDEASDYDLPIVVLVNEASASASEILAGALKYNDRAIVLGTRTVGKGSVQQSIPLEGGAGGIKLTTARYYLPNGENIHRLPEAERWGVDPNDGYYLSMTTEQLTAMVDVRREGTYERADGEPIPSDITPEWIDENMADLQLGAALRTMQAKLAEGDFLPVGSGDASVLSHLTTKEALEEQKNRYLTRIDEIDEEIERIDRVIAGLEPAEVLEDDSEMATATDPADIEIDDPLADDEDGLEQMLQEDDVIAP